MFRLTLVSVALLALLASSFASSFTANFQVRRPNQNGAYVVGKISYSSTTLAARIEFLDRNYTEIQRFNASFGLLEEGANYTQWAYQTGQACSGACRAAVIDYAFPRYYLDSFYVASADQPAFRGCAHYVPANASISSVTNIWFGTTGNVCRALWFDGADYIFDYVAPATFPVETFSPPSECLCAGPAETTDIVILVDRSASIGKRDYRRAKETIRDFSRRFDLAPNGVNVLIAHFDIDVELVLEFYQGTSQANIDAAVNTMNCSCPGSTLDFSGKGEWDEIPDGDDKDNVYCCARRSCVAKAISRASEFFVNGRPGSKKIILVVSDGKYNTKRDGSKCGTGRECSDDLKTVLDEATALHPGLAIYGLGVGKTDHLKMGSICGGRYHRYFNESTYWRECNRDDNTTSTPSLVGAIGCPVQTTFCDPTTCCGLCQCGECLPPTDCDNTDNCTITGLFGARCCSTREKICLGDNNSCTSDYCDPAQGCVNQAILCPPPVLSDPLQEGCWTRECAGAGICSSSFSGAPQCSPIECSSDAECNDGNACTTDTCVGNQNQRSCVWTPVQCDDGNMCTIDSCVAPSIGCTTRPTEPCDDGISCTTDSCLPSFGCIFSQQQCDDGVECTTDICDPILGRCDFVPKICPTSNNNCTLNYCLIGECTSMDLCPAALVSEQMTTGAIVGTTVGVVIGAAVLAVVGFVAYKIVDSGAKEPAGGAAGDFAAE